MNHETAVSKAKEIAEGVLAPAARQSDKEGRFSAEAVEALGQAGLLGLMLSGEAGGAGEENAHHASTGRSPGFPKRRR